MNSIDPRPWLEKLEDLVDLEHVRRSSDLQKKAFSFEPVDHVPTIIHYPLPAGEWPTFTFPEIYEEPAKMLLQQLGTVYAGAKLKDDRLYGIRANYGTGIISSMFGCEIRTFEYSLPIGIHVPKDRIDAILDAGVPDVRSGIVGKALDTVAYFRESLQPYPKLSKAVGSELLDIQGPFDNASIIWGSDIFLELYDSPHKIIRLSKLVCEAILAVVKEHRRIDGRPVDENDGCWNHIGGLCVRNDSAVSLGREHYDKFAKPFDEYLIGKFGGWIHFCGRAHQWWESLLEINGIRAINPQQGEFYDLYDMFEKCERARVSIVQWTVPLDARCRERIRTGFSRMMWVDSYDKACEALDRLHKNGHADE